MKFSKIFFSVLLAWFLSHTMYIIVDGLKDDGNSADVAVILGNKVNDDGTLSIQLEKRVEWGLKLFREHRVKKIIVSGGDSKNGYLEGDKMRAYLLNNNVPDSVIIVDNFGKNTRATAKNALRMRDSLHFKSIMAVSQYYHISRTKMLLRKNGLDNINSSSPKYFEWRDLYAFFREFFAYYSQL
jgi:vancomycin permeability regulator SanA